MTLLIVSFLAGVLTVLAPCVLPLLPVVIGSSVSKRNKSTPYVVVGSLALSIIFFTFLLKVSTTFIAIPLSFWSFISGGILILFGGTLMFPNLWIRLPVVSRLSVQSNKLLGKGHTQKSLWGDVLVGSALGPVFSSCSPTYFVILATVLPASYVLGTLYLLAYVAGLSLVLLLVAVLGEKFVSRLTAFSDPDNNFKKWIGVLFILVGVMIISGFDKTIETWVLNTGFLDVTRLEIRLLGDF